MKRELSITPGVTALEAERLASQLKLDGGLSPEERNETGQFSTPPILANDIARTVFRLWGDEEVRFLEPALGTGAFFSALLQTFRVTRLNLLTELSGTPNTQQ
jgi:adenine-specific DNA-methyltransferase